MAIPIPNKEAATVTKHLMDRYLSVFGTPTAIHSDQGKEFTAEVFKETLDRYKKMFNHVRNKNNAVIKRNAQLYTGKACQIEVGTRVWYLAPRKVPRKPMKLTDQWIGPFKVLSKPTAVLVEISPAD